MAKARKKPSLPSCPQPSDNGAGRYFNVQAKHMTSATDARGRDVAGPKAQGRVMVAGARTAQASKLFPIEGDVNDRKQRRIIHPLDGMGQKNLLSPWQVAAGFKLLDAWESIMCGPGRDLSDPQVDSTPNPEARTTVMLIKQARWVQISKVLPNESRAVIEHVVLNGKYLRDGMCVNGRDTSIAVERLRIALDCVADDLGLR